MTAKQIALAAAFMAFVLIGVGRGATKADPLPVSLVQLLATPERYEGRRVRLTAFCRLLFEEHALYLHREDAEVLNSENGVWLELNDDAVGDYRAADNAFATVEGTFTSKRHGHMGAWPASLTNISRLERTPTRADFEAQRQRGTKDK